MSRVGLSLDDSPSIEEVLIATAPVLKAKMRAYYQRRKVLSYLHNFRLYFKYSEPSGGVGRGRVGGRFAGPFFRNYDSEKAFIDSSTGSSVVVKRVLAEVRWAIREWWRIDNARSQEEITSIREAETRKAVAFFRAFVSEVGGSSDFLVVRSYPFDNKLINSLSEKRERIKKKYARKK